MWGAAFSQQQTRALLAGALVVAGVIATGDVLRNEARAVSAADCSTVKPKRSSTTFAHAAVGFGRLPGTPDGSDQGADRRGSRWLSKVPIFMRGGGTVTVRVPRAHRADVGLDWTVASSREQPRPDATISVEKHGTKVVVRHRTECARAWTAFPGGPTFTGRRCVRLRVRGPGVRRGSTLLGLRKDCSDVDV